MHLQTTNLAQQGTILNSRRLFIQYSTLGPRELPPRKLMPWNEGNGTKGVHTNKERNQTEEINFNFDCAFFSAPIPPLKRS